MASQSTRCGRLAVDGPLGCALAGPCVRARRTSAVADAVADVGGFMSCGPGSARTVRAKHTGKRDATLAAEAHAIRLVCFAVCSAACFHPQTRRSLGGGALARRDDWRCMAMGARVPESPSSNGWGSCHMGAAHDICATRRDPPQGRPNRTMIRNESRRGQHQARPPDCIYPYVRHERHRRHM